MLIGNILTIAVSVCIGLVGTCTLFKWRRVESRFKDTISFSFALFWFAMSFAWYATALSNWWRYGGYIGAAARVVYPLQFFLGVSMVLVAYFINGAVMYGKKQKIFFGYYLVLFCVFLYTLFRYELDIPKEAFFSGHILSPLFTRVVFILMFIPIWSMAVALLYRTAIRKMPADTQLRQFQLLASLSLVILGTAGLFDELGLIGDWVVTFDRIITLTGALSGYAAILALEDKEDFIV